METKPGIELELPGSEKRVFTHVVTDFTGTLSRDGVLWPGLDERIGRLARQVPITVLTADTFGTATAQLGQLPVEIVFIRTGDDKAEHIRGLKESTVIAIGNGRNDVPMMTEAALGIAVMGAEGAATALLAAADLVVYDPCDALDLLLNPLRLKAALRD